MAVFVIKGTRVRTRDGLKEFNSFRALKKNGEWVQVAFTHNINEKDLPIGEKIRITVPDDRWNMENANRFEYPRLWIKEIAAVEPYATDKKEKNAGDFEGN